MRSERAREREKKQTNNRTYFVLSLEATEFDLHVFKIITIHNRNNARNEH